MTSESIKHTSARKNQLAQSLNRLWFRLKGSGRFSGTAAYWESRYLEGGTSGAGSYGRLAKFKAETVNHFVAENDVQSVIEFGCGDGNQLALAQYPGYIGLDVSAAAVAHCALQFAADPGKSFFLYHAKAFVDRAGLFQADLALSLDVIFHLVEEEVYQAYMRHLFAAGRRFVIIYSSDFDAPQQFHERRHCFTRWVEQNCPQWKLQQVIKNAYPYDPAAPEETSQSDFYFYTI